MKSQFNNTKRTLIILAMILMTKFSAFAQQYNDYKIIQDNRTVVFFDQQKDRKALRIDLPRDRSDKPLILSFKTEFDAAADKSELSTVLADFIDKNNQGALNLESMMIPKTRGAADVKVFVTDFAGYQAFMLRNSAGNFNPMGGKGTVYQTLNGSTGSCQVNTSENTIFVCIESEVETQVKITMAELYKTDVNYAVWNKELKKKVYNQCMETESGDDDIAVSTCGCLTERISNEVTPRKYFHSYSGEQKNIIARAWNECTQEAMMNAPKSQGQSQSKINELILLGENQWKNQDYRGFLETYTQLIDMGRKSDDSYNRLAEGYFVLGDYENFKKYSYIAAGYKKGNLFVQAKLIRIALIEGDLYKAERIYKENKRDRLQNNMKFSKYMELECEYLKSKGYETTALASFEQNIL